MKQVVLIMVDTQRQDMLSCYDKTSTRTENLDELAKESMIFSNGFTCQPVCGPARSAIFTGLYPSSNGMIANCMQLGANIKTAGEWISPKGTECGYIGKWHLDGGDYFGYGKCPRGYNSKYWYDMRNFLDELSNDERKKSRVPMQTRMDDPSEDDTFAHRCVNKAIQFIDEFKDKDFFLTLSLDEPHDPSVCPRRFFKALKTSKFKFKRTDNVNASLKNKPLHQKIFAKCFKNFKFYVMRMAYKALFACNLFCDYEIGRVLDRIKALKIDPMIIYTSDHGDMLLSHGLMGKGCVMYNEITKVPFLISGGGFNIGSSQTPVSHIDILPTVLHHLNINIPKMLQGTPLQTVKFNENRDIFIEFTRYEVDHDAFMGYQPIRCIFDGRHKLVINLLTSDELYDSEEDPYELKNLINSAKHKKIRNALHDKLLQNMNVTRDAHRGYYWGQREWRKEYKPSFKDTGMTRQLQEEDFLQLDYSTGLPMKDATRKK